MRLKSIKLSGFKSFVDPTHFEMPGQLIGVVGPNGCGKSNIIDAVRWVLGESRASELRGESMQDVIFNGSGLRKPAGRASVELIFDNTDGRASGQWSAFAELSVKRVLTRDGASSYYINNQSVRRKDIHDMFMGTGLGPRAYAIIGQGMISRIIEAKPEELRIFLEEAAGVSKYKERRKDTESRLEDTRENLTRVEDILRELGLNLTKLEGQAEVAEQYKNLHSQMTEQQHLLWLVRQTEAGKEQDKFASQIRDTQTQLEEHIAKLRNREAQLEELRTSHYRAQDEVSTAQGSLYEVNAEVAKLENEIKYVQESRARLQQQLADLNAQLTRWNLQSSTAAENIRTSQIELDQARTIEDQYAQAHQTIQEKLPPAQAQYAEAQRSLDLARDVISSADKHLASLGERVLSIGKQIDQLEQRKQKLQLELGQLHKPDESLVQTSSDRYEGAKRKANMLTEQLAQHQTQLPLADTARNEAQKHFQEVLQKLHQTQAKLEALKALQQRIESQSNTEQWLDKHQLNRQQRLWKDIQVEKGWEVAFESILRERLTAIEVDTLSSASQLIEDAPPSKLAFYFNQAAVNYKDEVSDLELLSAKVKVKNPQINAVLGQWLHRVYVAQTIQEAKTKIDSLPTGGLIVVPQGHVLSKVGIQLYSPDSEVAGLLARAQEISNLEVEIKAQQLIHDEAKSDLETKQHAYRITHQAFLDTKQLEDVAVKEAHGFELDYLQQSKALEQYQLRHQQLTAELADLDTDHHKLNEQRQQSQAELDTAHVQRGSHGESLAEAQTIYQAANHSLDQIKNSIRDAERDLAEASFQTRSLIQRISDLTKEQDSSREQVTEVQRSLDSTQAELETLSDEVAQEKLQTLLTQRSAKEAALANARTHMDEISHQIREADEGRLNVERGIQPLRDKIVELQLKEQAARLNVEQFETMLSDAQADIELLNSKITPDMKVSSLQSEVNRLNQAIQSLGPVNMAALDELASARERKTFLDAQSADLIEAITTLTDAIQKIDAETRDLLQGTFDKVNHHFSVLFPELFGGGNAKLVMTGEEILDSGVQVMAQPPGKKNSTIHLLSGGEKALTAIALVFSLFQLNPAPFCLLDEVDAPLDDANTGRYADMVSRMSNNTQFVFISHNKITMEIAHQLIGVTMQEQGVSRIVAVDLEAAASMSEAA